MKGGKLLEASIRYSPNDNLAFALYGRNLGNERLWVSDVDLSVIVDATFSPLREGRVLGFEVGVRR